MNPPVNGKIQGLFKAFECFSSTFQGKFNFQGLFKTVLYIQVLFKNSEYDQEIPQSQTADNPVAPRGRAAQPSRDTRKTN